MDFATRETIYREIETERQTRVIGFITGDRKSLETQIAHDAVDLIVSLLDKIGPTHRLSLVLHTSGGSISAAWRVINLLRTFCEELEIIIPTRAMSAGTLMCLGADKLIMTKQAALGPIDPSVEHPLGPHIGNARVPVSAEAVHGYINEVKKDVKEAAGMATIWADLASRIHPVVLGEVFRRRAQIRFLAGKLIARAVPVEAKRKGVIDLLCSESGSHDYTINRREAEALGLTVEKPSPELYVKLSSLAQSFTEQLKVLEPYSPAVILGTQSSVPYRFVRGLIESPGGGCFGYESEGTLTETINNGQRLVNDQRAFEGWRKI